MNFSHVCARTKSWATTGTFCLWTRRRERLERQLVALLRYYTILCAESTSSEIRLQRGSDDRQIALLLV